MAKIESKILPSGHTECDDQSIDFSVKARKAKNTKNQYLIPGIDRMTEQERSV